MLESATFQTDFPPRTHQWLSTIPQQLYQKLVNAGLVGDRSSTDIPTLVDFLTQYMTLKKGGTSRSSQWKPGTTRNRKQSVDDLLLYFSPDKQLDQINGGEAEEWLHWMMAPLPEGRELSPATASKKLKDARQFFEFARRKQFVGTNPFDGIRLPPQDNPDRLVFV